MIHTSYHHVIHALLFHIIWNPSGEATSLSKKLKLLLFKILGGFTHFFNFHPWGNDPIWLYTIFQMGASTTGTTTIIQSFVSWPAMNPPDQAMPRNPPDCLTSASGCSVWTPSSAKPPMIPAPWAEHTQLLWHLAIWKKWFSVLDT